MATVIKKISVKTVIGGPAKIRSLHDGPIMRVFGMMRGTQSGEGENGPWIALIGNFQAINMETGEIFAAAKCFLPGAAGDIVVEAWNNSQDGENPAENMKFAFDIKKFTDDGSAVGYQYSAVPLIEASEADPLAEMARALPAIVPVPALPEPEAKGNKK
jgi:hypothetical protein